MKDHHEVKADDRSRIALGKVGVKPGDRFEAFVHPVSGEIKLTPMATIERRRMTS